MKRQKKKSHRKAVGYIRTLAILVACFVATTVILRLELEKRDEQAALDNLPVFARQSSASVEAAAKELAGRLETASRLIGAGSDPSSQKTIAILQALEESDPFVEAGIRMKDGSAVLQDGTVRHDMQWTEISDCALDTGMFRIGRVQEVEVDGARLWAVRLFVTDTLSGVEIFGTVELDKLFDYSYFRGLGEQDRHIVVFEQESGAVLLDTLYQEDLIGQSFYDWNLLDQVQKEQLEKPANGLWEGTVTHQMEDGQKLYLYAQSTGIPGWSLCAALREDDIDSAMGIGIPSVLAYVLLVLLYVVATVAVLLYQAMREKAGRAKLAQEVARNNTLMNAALPGSDVQLFELLPDGMIRLLSPEKGQGQLLKTTLETPRQLLAFLNCSGQWEGDFLAALEQAAHGQDSEVTFQTMDDQETWIQLKMEPLSDNEGTTAVGTIRDITEDVKQKRQREAATKLLNRMMLGTVAGIEISLEEDTWRMLWGWDTYADLLREAGENQPYSAFVKEQIAPTIHPKDRENYCYSMDRRALLSLFFSGTTRVVQEYRVKTEGTPGYEWHSAELYFFRDPESRQAKCNFFIRQVTEEKMRELEERRELEEKQQELFLRAKKLVESEDELDFVHVIADYYQGIYVVNLNDDLARSIKVPAYFAELLANEHNHLSATLERYGAELMKEEYLPAIQELLDYDRLREKLDSERQLEVTYQKRDGTWICVRVLPMPGYSDEKPDTLWVFEDETATVNLRHEEEKARVTAQAAEAASRAKSQFLANMSHDIRTPLNAILGMSELGLREDSAEKKDNCFRDIRGSGRILLENINSILDLSKIEAGKMELAPENYNILSTLHDTITVLRMRAQEKKLEFQAQVDETIPTTLYGDDVNISHIIMNLGSNAVKYTQEGTITMTVTWEPQPEDGILVIHMEDTGIGIRKEDLPYIFQSYGRLDSKENRHIEGTGLGLPICQKLTELMDGQLGVESVYGVGSDFWVRLPQKVVNPLPCGPYQEGIRHENDQNYNSFIAPEAAVLVVDDQPLNLKVCQGLLQPYGMEVYTARSGREALRQMTQVWPDLVFMDHMMPDMDGVEATRAIREMGKKDPYFAVVPIIALTANAMKGVREFFLENGFNDFVSKPIELDRLDDVLRVWLPEDKQKAPTLPEKAQEDEVLTQAIAHLPGVDTAQGMAYCGTAAIYQSTLTLFFQQLPERITQLEASWKSEDWETFSREAHSLKSASRWIGAMELGRQAEQMEMAGREGDKAQIDQGVPLLLMLCRQLEEAMGYLETGLPPEA